MLRALAETLCPNLSRQWAQNARKQAQQVCEFLWGVGFSLLGKLKHLPSELWEFSGNHRVLVIAPHPDDEAIGCGGAVIRHRDAGDVVGIVYVTDGRLSRAMDVSQDEMARLRRAEAESVVEAFDINVAEWLNFPEGNWSVAELRIALTKIIEEFHPDIIYAPSRVDVHREHHKVAHALGCALESLEDAAMTPTMRIYQIQVPLTQVLTNRVIDTSAVAAASQRLLDVYATQFGSTCRASRKWKYAARLYGLSVQGEEFFEVSAKQFSAMHAASPDTWPAKDAFAPLEFRSYTDPRAYFKGIAERRNILAIAKSVSPSNEA